jgi:hypothetical protein
MKNLLQIFQSSSNYFHQDSAILSENRKNIDLYLQLKDYSLQQRAIYLKAYDYFVQYPLHYDGATMTEDLFDVAGLELASMLHDYLYIEYNVAGNYRYRLMADKLFRREMRKMNKSTWNGGARYVLLLIASFVFQHTAYSYLFKNRRMSLRDKGRMEGVYEILVEKEVNPGVQKRVTA